MTTTSRDRVDLTHARRYRHGLCRGPKALTSGSNGIEIGGASHWSKPFADWTEEPSVAAHQPRDGDALHQGSALDAVLKDVGDPGVKTAEQRVEATQHSRLDLLERNL